MAKSLNRVTLLGNVGHSPDVKATPGGTQVASFTIATQNRFKDRSGEWKDSTDWHSCVAFGRLAEIIGQYVGKGSKLYVEGRLQTRSWDDKETGKKKFKTEVIVSDITLLGAPGSKGFSPEHHSDEESERVGGSDGTRGYMPHSTATSSDITDDDIPF